MTYALVKKHLALEKVLVNVLIETMFRYRCIYAQSAYSEFGFQRVLLKQTLNSKGWEFSCPWTLIGGLPESLTQGFSVGKLLIGGPGVKRFRGLLYQLYYYCYYYYYYYYY